MNHEQEIGKPAEIHSTGTADNQQQATHTQQFLGLAVTHPSIGDTCITGLEHPKPPKLTNRITICVCKTLQITSSMLSSVLSAIGIWAPSAAASTISSRSSCCIQSTVYVELQELRLNG
jgi:hypothetical protein